MIDTFATQRELYQTFVVITLRVTHCKLQKTVHVFRNIKNSSMVKHVNISKALPLIILNLSHDDASRNNSTSFI